MNLNPEQITAIGAQDGVWLVSATAGSGKTEVLVQRVKRLLSEGQRIQDILVLTFTKEAADNFSKRSGITTSKLDRFGFRTFHSFCLRLIKDEARHLPFRLSEDPTPQDSTISRLLAASMKNCGIPNTEFKTIRGFISKVKRQRLSEEDVFKVIPSRPELARTCFLYNIQLRDAGILDFDDMVIEAVNLLESNPSVRERAQIKWCMTDEAQDTDDLQMRFLQLITEKYKNLYCVGDYSQALYSFRGAHPENLINFEQWFPDVRRLLLPENFRSTQNILKFSKENAPVRDALAEAVRTANADGSAVEFREYKTSEEEAEAAIAEGEQNPSGTAILARTNAQLGALESLCIEKGIRYQRLGRTGFWNAPEIRQLVSFAVFCINTAPPSGFGMSRLYPHRNYIRSLPVQQALRTIVQETNMERLYSDQDDQENDTFALDNIRRGIQIGGKFSTLKEFVNHAHKGSHASGRKKNALTLSTIHQMKGLEASTVIVLGVNEGVIPHKKGEIEEEKRIWYVAITRPRHRLRITFTSPRSPFILRYLTPEILSQKSCVTDQYKIQMPLL